MKKSIIGIVFFIVCILGMNNISWANGKAFLQSDLDNIEKGQTFQVSIRLEDTSVAALTAELLWDDNKVEYIEGPENTNRIGNGLIYTWWDVEGGQSPQKTGEIASFVFKAKEAGQASFGLKGEFYDENAQLLPMLLEGENFTIVEKNEDTKNEEEKVADDNAYLKVLRINEEGLQPYFSKEIMEYYFFAGVGIDKLEITAIPENIDASVQVFGNTNFKEGLNKIEIIVSAKDGKNKNVYTIYVTKTAKEEQANARLETLALENVLLTPEFDANQTHYKAEVPNNLESLKLLAVPESRKANVQILGNEKLQVGNNKVVVVVTAENGYTIRRYQIDVYRRNLEEEEKNKEEELAQAERVSQVLAEKEEVANEETNETAQINKTEKGRSGIIIVSLCIVLVVIGYLWYRYKNRKRT